MHALKERSVAPDLAATAPGGLSSRDFVASCLGFFGALVVWATLADRGWPLLGSYRSASAVVAVTGMAMCASGSVITQPFPRGAWMRSASVIGGLTGIVAIVAIVTGSQEMFVSLAALIGALWITTTIRHAFMRV